MIASIVIACATVRVRTRAPGLQPSISRSVMAAISSRYAAIASPWKGGSMRRRIRRCGSSSRRRTDVRPTTGSMIPSRGSPTLYCAGFHLNISSMSARSETCTSGPTSASFVRNTGP